MVSESLINLILSSHITTQILFIPVMIIAVLSIIFLSLISIYLFLNILIILKKFKFKEFYERLKPIFHKLADWNFTSYIDLLNLAILGIGIYFNFEGYLLVYIPLWLISRVFISIVKDILVRAKKDKISEFWFFVYICIFVMVIIAYISSFSFLYTQAQFLNQGKIIPEDNTLISKGDFFNYSFFTFFRMEYNHYESSGITTFLTSLEILISELLLITFIGILVGVLLNKLRLKALGGRCWNEDE